MEIEISASSYSGDSWGAFAYVNVLDSYKGTDGPSPIECARMLADALNAKYPKREWVAFVTQEMADEEDEAERLRAPGIARWRLGRRVLALETKWKPRRAEPAPVTATEIDY